MAGQIEELACQKMFGLPNKRVNVKAKYFSITKTISNGTPDFFIFCALNESILFSNLLQSSAVARGEAEGAHPPPSNNFGEMERKKVIIDL